MAEVKTEQEPSIEEILESIRQIISEDTEEPQAKPATQTVEAVKQSAPPPSNLSLSSKPEAPVPPSNLSLAQASAPAAAAVEPLNLKPEPAAATVDKKPPPLDLTEKVAPPTAAPIPEPPSPITIEMMDSPMTNNDKADGNEKSETDKTGSLISAETAAVVTDTLAKILASNVAIETERSSAVGKVTLEDLARELMKPLIKTWIDQNLPGIIDKAVQKEVEKLSRRVLDR